MTLDSTKTLKVFDGNGAATSFEFQFKAWEPDQIAVQRIDADGILHDLTLNTDFTVALAEPKGGTVTYPKTGDPLPTGEKLAVMLDMAIEQNLVLPRNHAFLAPVVEDALDKTTARIKQIEQRTDRAIVINPGSDVTPEGLLTQINAAALAAQNSADVAAELKDETGEIKAETEVVKDQTEAIKDQAEAAKASIFNAYKPFTGDGSTTDFALDYEGDPMGKNIFVVVGGVVQAKDHYSLEADGSGVYKVLRFSTAPGDGVEIATWMSDPTSNPDVPVLVEQAIDLADANILRANVTKLLTAVYGDEAQTHTGTDLSGLTVIRNHIQWTLTADSQFSDVTLPYDGTYVFHVYPAGHGLTLAASYKTDGNLPDVDTAAGEVRIVVEQYGSRKSIISLQNMEA